MALKKYFFATVVSASRLGYTSFYITAAYCQCYLGWSWVAPRVRRFSVARQWNSFSDVIADRFRNPMVMSGGVVVVTVFVLWSCLRPPGEVAALVTFVPTCVQRSATGEGTRLSFFRGVLVVWRWARAPCGEDALWALAFETRGSM